MKKFIFGISVVFMIALAGGSLAEDMSHDMSQMTTAGGMNEMDHSSHGGELIHEGVVDGYRFAYHLTDIREKMAAMKAAGHTHEGMDVTHHLMVYIMDPNGATVENAQVGYLVEGPDGSKQKLMCMCMAGGYGSDVNLGGTGEYVIKTKVVAGDTKLIDEFVYKVED